MTKAKAEPAVRIYPLPGAYIPGVPHIEQEVSPEEAERLLAYQPPAFARTAPSIAPVDTAAEAEPQE